MRKAYALPVLTLAVLPALAHGAKEDLYAITGAKIVTVSGAVLDTGTIVLRDGVIAAVGRDVVPPVGARVLSGKGLTLTPGLIDGFGGVGLPAPGPAPAASPANPLAPQAMALDRLRPAEVAKARDAGITSALVIAKEGILPGQSVLVNLGGDQAEAMVVKQPAALHLHMATLQGGRYPTSLMGTEAYARQALYDAARYRDARAAYEKSPLGKRRPAYDSALEAWQGVLAGREPLVVTAGRENDIHRALALADEFKVKVVVAGAPQAFRVASIVKSRGLPLLVTVNFDPPRAPAFGAEDVEKEKKEIDDAERNPAELHKAGVRFALVSGYAPDFLAGVRKAIERGLPRDAALRAVTLDAASVLGVADRLGSLEAGKIANVVAWSGDPLTKDAKARMVFVDGRLYEPEEHPEPSPSPGSAPSASPAPSSSPSPSPSPSPIPSPSPTPTPTPKQATP
jgi:imidazolonepropionase-like amidohydrolase